MVAPNAIERAPDVVFQTLAGEEGAVLLHLGTGQYHTLNPMGSRIWELLETPLTESELGSRLEGEFDADRERLEDDMRSFLQDLSVRQLIRRVPSR